MDNATVADFELIDFNDKLTAGSLPVRVLTLLRTLEEDDGAYQISRLRHSLQGA